MSVYYGEPWREKERDNLGHIIDFFLLKKVQKDLLRVD
jgi:hypothetical protein